LSSNKNEAITLDEMHINTPIVLNDKQSPFEGVEYNFRVIDKNNEKQKIEFWLSKFKPPSSTYAIKREFNIQVLGFENAKFLAMK
jgi:hypothetical protein